VDDSIVRVLGGKPTLLRRARGYAPLPIMMRESLPEALAAGGHLKTTVAFSRGRQVVLSQHLGDLDTLEAQQHYRQTVNELRQFYGLNPQRIVHDLHPGYFSSQNAQSFAGNIAAVQHHYAHILSCMAEHDLSPPLLGIAWDGTGLGTDGNLWGGEFLTLHDRGFERFAYLRPFPLPGGSSAVREPRRTLAGMLYELYGAALFEGDKRRLLKAFSATEVTLLPAVLSKNINTPRSTSAGRLFDAFAALLQVCPISSYEGQAAMLLEQTAAASSCAATYPFEIADSAPLTVDWRPMLAAAIADLSNGEPAQQIAAKFHNTLGEMTKVVALRAGQRNIVLSGGCFQNARLLQSVLQLLQDAGFSVHRHERIPPNDGGLALGQIYACKFG
jgi:hydrogenase maturation protein HypF